MAFKSIQPGHRRGRSKNDTGGPLYYSTPTCRGAKYGRAIRMYMRPELMAEVGFEPGDRIDVQIDRETGVAQLVKVHVFGWSIKPIYAGCDIYNLRINWLPDFGLPLVESAYDLTILHKDAEANQLIFKLPEA